MISKNKLKELSVYKQQKYCESDGVFVVEGVKMGDEALAAKAPIKVVCATKLWLAQHPELPINAEIYEVEELALARLSHMPTPNEVWILLDRNLRPVDSSHNLTLALDHLQDPGNLGTIVRLADWYGIRDIFASPTTVDVFNHKVVQATMGAIARVQVHYVDLEELFDDFPTLPVCGTFLDGDNIYSATLPERGFVVFGNEGQGIGAKVGARATQRLLIPKAHDAGSESLNVGLAAAITISEFKRQLFI